MKVCSVCEIQKPERDFFFRDKRADRLLAQCKDCYTEKRNKIWRDYYNKHGSQYRTNVVERNRKLKNNLRLKMMLYLSGKSCVLCGNSDPRVLKFDHIDPKTKSFSIAQGISSVLSWENILIEIEKCQILCANCHKIKTAAEQGWCKNKMPHTLAYIS